MLFDQGLQVWVHFLVSGGDELLFRELDVLSCKSELLPESVVHRTYLDEGVLDGLDAVGLLLDELCLLIEYTFLFGI